MRHMLHTCVLLSACLGAIAAEPPAFPGAEGWGADSVGGRGGRVIAVTTLADSGPGSLRAALTATGPRTVVFRVGGTITLASRISVSGEAHSYLTIAGQTAPGDGIQITNWDLAFVGGVHDVVARNLRLRPGHTGDNDWSKHALLVYGEPAAPSHHLVFDHCSFQWGPDENICLWGSVHHVTVSRSVSEGMEHNVGSRFENDKAALYGDEDDNGAQNHHISQHHCVFVNCDQRNPLMSGNGPYEIVSNLIYNWGSFGTAISGRTTGAGVAVDLIANRYIRGPLSSTSRYAVGLDGSVVSPDSYVFVQGNLGPFRDNNSLPEWAIVGQGYDTSRYWTMAAPSRYQRASAWGGTPRPITAHAAATLLDELLPTTGACVPRQDAVDLRCVADVRNGTGVFRQASNFSTAWFPTLANGTPPTDGDGDGISDAWENAHGLSAADGSDGARRAPSGYTWLEAYLASLMPRHGLDLTGDADGDGAVTNTDLALVKAQFGRSGGAISDQRADVDGSGTVDARDLATVTRGLR
jgi:pectate lyase